MLGYLYWTLPLLYNWELAVVIYYTKIMLIITSKDISAYRFPQPPCFFMWHYLIFCLCCFKVQAGGAIFTIPSVSALMLIQYIDSHASSLVFPIPIWFLCSWFSALSCSATGIILLLPLIAMHSMIVISYLIDDYGCKSFCIPALVNGLLQSMSSESMPMCSLSSLAVLFLQLWCSLVCQCMTLTELMVIHMPGISSSLFVSWLCLDRQ